jgi:cytidylate kinase
MGFVIAVDGPAASGKGTVASRLATLHSLPFLDTGSLYRAVAVAVLRAGADPATPPRPARPARALDPATIDENAIRSAEAGEAASLAPAHAEVRAALLALQREFAAQPTGAVLDGRDIGTVIAPEAGAKLFVTASPEVRAERRWRQHVGRGEPLTLADVLDDIRRRDERDAGRGAAPMRMADDAVLLDTSELTIEQAVDAARRIVEAARARWTG